MYFILGLSARLPRFPAAAERTSESSFIILAFAHVGAFDTVSAKAPEQRQQVMFDPAAVDIQSRHFLV